VPGVLLCTDARELPYLSRSEAGLVLDDLFTDENGLFGLAVARHAPS
jgi:hypothetical protein